MKERKQLLTKPAAGAKKEALDSESLSGKPQRTQIMTLREGAKYLGVHEVTMYRLIKETDIPALKLRGQWRFKKDLLDAWLMTRMQREKHAGRASS